MHYRTALPLADRGSRAHPLVSETEADAIRATFVQQGELAAAIELRRLCSRITDNVQALACARTIAGWKPLPTAKLAPNRRRYAGKKKPRIFQG
jgi:hypothetical protein